MGMCWCRGFPRPESRYRIYPSFDSSSCRLTKRTSFRFSLWNLYALSRVNDFLLTPFQHEGQAALKGPHVTPEQYVTFFEEIGFTAFKATTFSSLHNEIVECWLRKLQMTGLKFLNTSGLG